MTALSHSCVSTWLKLLTVDGHTTTQLGYDDANDREADLGDALIDGDDPRELLIETEFATEQLYRVPP